MVAPYGIQEFEMICKTGHPWMRARRTTNQTIVPSTWTNILHDTVQGDVGGNFDLATGRFVVDTPGMYWAFASVNWVSVTAWTWNQFQLLAGGCNITDAWAPQCAQTGMPRGLSLAHWCTAGQFIYSRVWHNDGVNKLLNGGASGGYTQLSVALVYY